MALDIAILGSGPVGLDAARYARFLGYGVAIYEQAAEVAVAVKAWGHVRMFIPFRNEPVAAGIGRGIGP